MQELEGLALKKKNVQKLKELSLEVSFTTSVFRYFDTEFRNVACEDNVLSAVLHLRPFLFFCNIFSLVVQLVKNTTDKSRLHVIFSNKKKYNYQFQSVLERESFCLQIRQMKSLHSAEQDVDNVSVFIGTWNMGKLLVFIFFFHSFMFII